MSKILELPTFNFSSYTDSEILKEMINIGLGHAVTPLTQMLGHRIQMSVPKISFLSPFDIKNKIEKDFFKSFLCYSVDLSGDASGKIINIFGEHLTLYAINLFFQSNFTSLSETDETTRSVIQEMTNITAGGFCNILASLSEALIDISIPNFCENDVYKAFSDKSPDKTCFDIPSFVIDSCFIMDGDNFKSKFIFIPSKDTTSLLFNSFIQNYNF